MAADIEAESSNGRALRVWLDEAEIPLGGSVPGHINRGLETSHFVSLLMTPAYFDSPSGWIDAEWHAAL
ncbi:MAG: toll/interleukin-1 receptor domain-containing protein [Acetobacteraceae bacterium]